MDSPASYVPVSDTGIPRLALSIGSFAATMLNAALGFSGVGPRRTRQSISTSPYVVRPSNVSGLAPHTRTCFPNRGSSSTVNGPPSFAVAPAVMVQFTSGFWPSTVDGSPAVADAAGIHHSADAGWPDGCAESAE